MRFPCLPQAKLAAPYWIPIPKSILPRIQAQAWIDLAFRLRGRFRISKKSGKIVIHTSHHTHFVIGTGSGDPEKMDPRASRETLDHSIMHIFAAALHTGFWHHVKSYAPELVDEPALVRLWQKIRTAEDPEWTRRYHTADPREKAFGGRVEISLAGGANLIEEIAVADAHPLGAHPFARPGYIRKFQMLTDELLSPSESARFLEEPGGRPICLPPKSSR